MSKYTIGIDLGGTTMTAGLVDENYKIIGKTTWATRLPRPAEDLEKALADLCRTVAKENKVDFTDVKYVGIGTPGSVNFTTGFVGFNTNFGYYDWNLGPDLEAMLGCKVYVENDANAAAIGEMQYGVARGMKNFIMITLGTGVGSGIVVDGHMVYGSDGFAGELGHTIIRRENGRPCGCGRKGCLETYCSATGVARTAREFLATSDEPSLLREMNPEEITSLDVSIAASKGDALANRIYEFTGQILGEACSDFMAFSSPEAFVFFGGLTKAGDLLMKPLKKAYDENVLKIYKDKAKFLISSLDDASAAVLGASAIGWEL